LIRRVFGEPNPNKYKPDPGNPGSDFPFLKTQPVLGGSMDLWTARSDKGGLDLRPSEI
jgi:hypothetical protein